MYMIFFCDNIDSNKNNYNDDNTDSSGDDRHLINHFNS